MAIFEIEGPDGKVYEVEANSIEDAAKAFDAPHAQEAPRKYADNLSPEDYIATPSGQMQHPDTFAGRMSPGIGGAFATGAEQGAFWGGSDELAGAAGAAALGSWGTPGERYEYNLERERAEMEAARRDHPVASFAGEALGSVATGGAVANAGRAALSKAAPGAASAIRDMLSRNMLTRATGGALAGAAGAGTYGFASGEGGLEPRRDQALNAGMFGAGVGGAASFAGDGIQAYLNSRAGRKATDAMVAATPTADDLLARGGQMIDDAVATGTTATPDQTKALAQSMRQTLMKNGVIGPQGRVIAGGRPKINDAMKLADEFFGQSMTPAQMRAMRKALQTAAQSADGQEARLGAILLDQFDGWASQMMPGIPAANATYAAGKRGEMIDEAVNLAGIRAGQFTGSGYENALRTEFRALARKIEKGQIKGLSPEQIAAINRVASGGPVENIARDIGKAAPTGVVSASLGGGVPFLIGNAIGGPGVGAAAGAGAMAAGALGRRAATSMQARNAAVASALMRGGKVPQVAANPNTQRVIEDLLRNALTPTVSQ